MKRVIVVGSGPAGLMAAGQAALQGAEVLLLEKKSRPGLKLAITGKKRCNVTNAADLESFLKHFGRNGKFMRQAFQRYFRDEVLDFFNSLGVELQKERGGRYFPSTLKAQDLVNRMVAWAEKAGVRFRYKTAVKKLWIENEELCGVICEHGKEAADQVILATGGASYPATGSTGDAYEWLAQCGHKIVTPLPALIPLITELPTQIDLRGVDLRHVNLALYIKGKKKKELQGEMGFNSNGIGGSMVLKLSYDAVVALERGHAVEMVLDLKPGLSLEQLERRLQKELEERKSEELRSILRKFLPEKMVQWCLIANDLDGLRRGDQVSAKWRRTIRNWIKEVRMPIQAARSLSEAIVTAGGVSLKDVDPLNFSSKKVAGLYLIGELLDLHADTGGYNIQAALTGGYLAAQSATE